MNLEADGTALDQPSDPRAVFVVHGRNESLRKSMFEFLRAIGLEPIEWSQAVALTGQASPYIGSILDVAFDKAAAVVVLMTPDEVAYLQPAYAQAGDTDVEPAGQARPNVLFEAGMALGRDQNRTVIVEIGETRPFSDIAGRHIVRLTNTPKARQDLANRLRIAGCEVDLSGTDWHDSGDFTAPTIGAGLPLARRVPSGRVERPAVDFDLRYVDKGSKKIDKLQIINRGSEDAFNVRLSVPDDAVLDIREAGPIAKIPGRGKYVSIDVLNEGRLMGGSRGRVFAFDVTVHAETEVGETMTQDVFLDMNG